MNNESTHTPSPTAADSHHAALFASLVMQQANMALIFLGHAPHPQTGQTTTDVQAAGVFIDTLEMLAAKTNGNLSKLENDLLQQNLTSLRMAFVAAVDTPTTAPTPGPASASGETHPAAQEEPARSAKPPEATDDELRKKFVKKY